MKRIRCRDSGDFFADRYSILFDNGDVFAMSADADMPNGCCIYIGNIHGDYSEYDYLANSADIDFDKLPEGTKKQIEYLEGVICQ